MAFLKRIEARGFKSFANKTNINFTDGLTVIVGPNGSGKSNINDAIKWVLGESSKKTLRASSSLDMIFSGSDSKKESDMAEVTLVFNNEDNILDISYSEVSITRRTYRDQEQNEYYINKNLVRRKDVKNLFLDTGLGNTDLSIISQGSVSKVTEAKPDDIKELLNEASGVARYQQQKDESVKKLERVSQNLNIFNVKLTEIEKQLKPLEKAKIKAEKYLDIKEKLSKIELPLIKEQLKNDVIKKHELDIILSNSKRETNTSSIKIEEIKEKQSSFQQKIIDLESELFHLQTKQSELSEKRKTFSSSEGSKELEYQIKETLTSIADLNTIHDEAVLNEGKLKTDIVHIKDREFELDHIREKKQYKLNSLEYELLKFSSSNYDNLGKGTRILLENKHIFNSIYGIVSELIAYKDEYEVAINHALGNKLNNLVVSSEEVIKQAINWLKTNKNGIATFIPANKVKERWIEEEYLNILNNVKGFIGTLESVIRTKSVYKKVVASLAGNILLFENVDTAFKAAKLTGYKFMIVTLDGDLVYPGFVVRGGENTSISTSARKDQLNLEIKNTKKEYEKSLKELKDVRDQIHSQNLLIHSHQNEQVRSQERLTYLETNLTKLLEQYKSSTGSNFNISKIKVKSSPSTASLSLEGIKNKIKTIQVEKQNYQKEVLTLKESEDKFRDIWQKSIESNTKSQLEYNTISSRIENDLRILNKDYQLTLEALEETKIDTLKIPEEKANELRIEYRNEIEKMGYVDLESIDKYNEIAKDYKELHKNTQDLIDSKEKLLSTIEGMDKEMIHRLRSTFDDLNQEFQKIFETLFRGGEAKLVYLEPEDILSSGVEIVAKAPNKQVKKISLYSGGEKSLIALSLIFAINAVRKLPLLLLDEVEAALDEANVERFAKYAKKMNQNTQLIIVTHRPGTMEKADVLYGVTMQEKGVTNIVSVKLQEAVELTT